MARKLASLEGKNIGRVGCGDARLVDVPHDLERKVGIRGCHQMLRPAMIYHVAHDKEYVRRVLVPDIECAIRLGTEAFLFTGHATCRGYADMGLTDEQQRCHLLQAAEEMEKLFPNIVIFGWNGIDEEGRGYFSEVVEDGDFVSVTVAEERLLMTG